MRKIFTFLFAALMSVGSMMADTTVTWGVSDFSSITDDYLSAGTKTVKGISITVNAGTNNLIRYFDVAQALMFTATNDNAFTFSTELGNITKIECTTQYAKGTIGDGWTIGANSATWEGNTNTLNFCNAGSMLVVSNIIFTIGDAEPEPEPEQQEESLLTTLTFGGSDTYGETTSGVVTVTATNVGSYNGTYGWLLDEGGSLSVTAKEGYTITKCVFRQNAKAPITDTEAPFEIHANGWGTIIEDPEYDMNGVTSIEVYGYAASAPEPEPADQEITPNADPENPTVYYSTFYDSANKYALPENVEAYIVTTVSGDAMQLQKVADAGQTIPAGAGVILKARVTPFILTPSDAEAVSVEGNRLEGSDGSINTPSNCYVLSCENNLVGFYHYTALMLNPHKAYLIYSGSQAPRRLRFAFDQATGIENVQGDNVQSTKVLENGVLYIMYKGTKYNVQGQEVK